MTPGFNFKLEKNINCLMNEEQFGCVFAPKFVIVVRIRMYFEWVVCDVLTITHRAVIMNGLIHIKTKA